MTTLIPKFDLKNGGATPAGAINRPINEKLEEFISVKDFGATGDGVTNDTVAIQAAIDSLGTNGGVVYFPTGTYLIARNIGTNDRWGIKVINSNITLQGEQATIKRFNTDISTYALAYPLFFVGTPDSNVAALTENVVISGFNFIGNNTQHTIGGSVIHDFRNAIEVKNSKNLVISNNNFTQIDSAVVYYQKPAETDYANSVVYNKTKNYNSSFINNSCVAVAHSTVGRNVIHAVVWSGVDFCNVSSNYFEWCDDCVAGEGTYDYPGDTEDSTWNDVTLGAVKRVGRHWNFTNNQVYNSSEHACYVAGLDVLIEANQFYTDEPTICAYDIVKIRGRDVNVTGNNFSNYACAIQIAEPSYNVAATNNTIFAPQSIASLVGAAVISLTSFGLEAYYAARPWFTYQDVMRNFNISNNTIEFPPTTASVGLYQIAFRIYTDGSSATFTDGEIQSVNFSNNTISNYKIGCYFVNQLFRTVCIDGNIFNAKGFTTAGFNGSTTMGTYAPVVIYETSTAAGQNIQFTNNFVRGSTYLFSTYTGGGTSVQLPFQIQGNTFNYVIDFKSADMVTPGANQFTQNVGLYFLNRTAWFPSVGNSLNDGTNANSAYKSLIQYNGANVVYYTNDSGTTITLG